MILNLTVFLFITAILTLIYDYSNAQDLQELIQEVKEKIIRLEQTGRIKRGYEPYTEPDLLDEGMYFSNNDQQYNNFNFRRVRFRNSRSWILWFSTSS